MLISVVFGFLLITSEMFQWVEMDVDFVYLLFNDN